MYNSVQGTAIYKSAANSSAMLLSPTSVVYLKEEAPSGWSLSPGAVAGIAVAAAVLLATAVGLLVRQARRQRSRSSKDVERLASSSGASSLPATASGPLKDSRQASKEAPEGAAPAPARAVSGGTVQPGLPPRPSRQSSTAAPVVCRTMSNRSIGVAPAMAPSPFAAAAMQAFPSSAAAVGSPGAAGPATAATPRHPSLPLRSLSTASEDAPVPELLRLVEQQDLEQKEAGSALNVGAQLLALPSNLPPELASWVISPASITLLTWPNGSLQELGSGAR